MRFSLGEISVEDARHTLWAFGDQANGWQPGSFTAHLLSAGGHADADNLHRLALGFPSLAEAVRVARFMPHGMAALVRVAEGRL